MGRPAAITDGAGRTTRHSYLPGGRLEKTEYPDGTYISYKYDSIGRLKKKTDQNGRSITYTYDCMGRILTVSGSAGQEKSYTYDAMGNVTSATDADGNVTKYAYTLNGRLKEVTDALGNKTEYAYDKADRLIYICQHGQAGEADRTTAYERDAFGQVVCIRDASGGEEHFRYDALGRMTEKTDREGLVTAYTYTPDGRPESILYDDGRSAQMEYTPLRQLAKVKDWLGETKSSVTAVETQSASQTIMEGQCAMSGAAWDSVRCFLCAKTKKDYSSFWVRIALYMDSFFY